MRSFPYGGPSEAVMAANELDGLDVGDTVEGTVVKTSPEIRISRKLAKGKASLDLLRQMYENRLPVEGKIAARNKGGFDVNIGGLRAFCPLSQIALGQNRQSRSVHRPVVRVPRHRALR